MYLELSQSYHYQRFLLPLRLRRRRLLIHHHLQSAVLSNHQFSSWHTLSWRWLFLPRLQDVFFHPPWCSIRYHWRFSLLKPKAKIFLSKTRPKGSRKKPFYKQNSEGNNFPQSTIFNMQKRFCIFCKKYGDHHCGFCKVTTFNQKYNEEKCMKHKACLCCLKTTDTMTNNCPNGRLCMVFKKYYYFNLNSRQNFDSFLN